MYCLTLSCLILTLFTSRGGAGLSLLVHALADLSCCSSYRSGRSMRAAPILLAVLAQLLEMRALPRPPIRHLVRFLSKTNPGDGWDAASSGMTLVIVESPAKARTIQRFLDPARYLVDFSAGHIRDLASSARDVPAHFKKIVVSNTLKLDAGRLGVDVHNSFDPIYVPLPGKEDILKRLSRHTASCSRILLASDEDREGEAIAWHLTEVLKPQVPYKRAVFHEITKEAILSSFANPR